MKKLLLTLFCLFAMFTVKAQCDYTLSGTDSWGDGWNGATIDIDVAGVTSSFTLGPGTSSNSVTIPSYTGDIVTFAFNSGSYDGEIGITLTGPDGTSLYASGAPAIDGIFVTDTSVSTCAAPSCSNPSSLASSAITDTTADLAWTAGGTEASWDIEVVDLSTGTATGIPTDSAATNSYQATSLDSNNEYQVYVRANCGAGEVSDWIFTSFTTACPPAITTFPSTTDFTLNPPTACWTQASAGDPSTGPSSLGSSEWNAGRSYNSVPSNRVNLYNLGSAEWLISPTYDIPALVAHELIVNVAVTNYNSTAADTMGSDDEVQLLQTTDAGVTWTNITTWNAANQPATLGTSFTADLTSLSGTVQFAIWASEGLVDDSEDFDFHVGAFTVREIPNCLEPTAIVIADVVSTTATASWTESNTSASYNFQYEINEVLTTGNVLFDSGTVTSATIDIVGLTVDSEYEIRVRANCGSGFGDVFSAWSSYVSWTQTEAPGCALNATPVDGSTTNTGGTITFTWDAPTTGGAATAYSFVYGTTIPGMFTISTNAISPYTVSGITPGSTFYYQIVPTNAGGEASSCSIQAVTTEAAPAAPQGLTCGFGDEETSKFTESFDAQGTWSGDFGGAGGWGFDTDATGSTGTGPTGPQDAGGAYMFYEASSATGSASAVSPVIDLSAIDAGNGAELSFYMHAFAAGNSGGSGMGTLRVGASTSPTGPFTNLLTWGGSYQTASADPWYQIGADVSAYVGGDLYIEFNHTTAGDYEGDMSIDTMEVVACQLVPDCAVPTDLTATGQTLTTTDLAWTAGGTESFWNIEVYELGADTSTATPVYTETGATQTSTTATGLELGDYTAYVQADCGATQAISDASAAWIGYANVFELPENGGGYQFGSGWALGDLKSVPDPVAGTVTLQPNFNTYGDGSDAYWVNQLTGEGNKTFEGNTYVQNDDLVGNAITFSGDVSSYTLDAGYTATAFIKVFNADYSFLKTESTALTTAGSFLVTYTNVEAGDAHVQYGYQVVGPNANPADEVALGSIVIVDGTNDGVSEWATTNFSIDYCTSTPSSNDAQGISNVQLGTTDFPTGDVTYADYRDTVVDLELDNTANLQVSFATGYTYGTNVWIDFNDDLVFDTTELVFTGTSLATNPTTLDASFDIAVDAAQGTHNMRIGTADSGQGTPDPCYSGSYGVTIDMAVNVIIPGSCTSLTIWDGTAWSNGAPDANAYAHIAGAYATGTNGDIDACSLAINAATTVDALGYVNIDGDINVKSAGSLTVAHTGSVVQVQETATTTNGGAISVLVDTPDLDVLDFMVMGSPMSAETREGVWSTAWNVQDHTTANFNSIAGVTGFNFLDTELDDWNLYVTGTLDAGEGFLVRPQASLNGAGGVFNYDFNTGTLNSGVVTQTLDFNVTELESPNMLSNPYASAIDADAFLTANPEISGLYFWEHNTAPSTTYPGANTVGKNYSMDDVSFYNALGGVAATSGGAAPNGVIATGQGFGVFATAGGTATFNNAMRLTSGNTTLRNNPIAKDRLWLQVTSTMYNASGNTLVGFLEDATAGIDTNYDNGRIASVVSLYSHIEGSDRGYSVQGREAFDNGMTVALGFSSIIEEVTSYKISLSDFDGEAWLDASPYLVDNQTGVVTNLMEDSYNFTSDMGEFNDRFEIVFQDRSLGSQESLASSIAMYPNPASDVVTIASPTAAITMVAVRDIRGRLILNKAVASKNVTTVDVASLDSALYLVTITTDSGSLTSRLIIE